MTHGMTDLSNVEPAGDGDYLDAGEYLVTVKETRNVRANSGTQGVEFTLVAANGQKTRMTRWLTDKALPMLRRFADDCGITADQLKNWAPEMHIGKEVIVTVERDDRGFHHASRSRAVGKGDPPAGRSEQQAPPPTAQHPYTGGSMPNPNDDLPF